MRNLAKVVACISLMVVGACGTMPNRYGPENLDAKLASTEGVVVFSTGAAAPCFQAASFVAIAPAGSAYDADVRELVGVDVWSAKSDFADHQGRINALKLPAGDYEMYIEMIGHSPPPRLPTAPFSVRAGEAVYLGEFYLEQACQSWVVAHLRDQEARDLAFVREKNPGLASLTFQKRIAHFTDTISGVR